MRANETQPPTRRPIAPASVPRHQLDLALDHPRLKGLTPSERHDAIVIVAQLMLEARGIVSEAMREDNNEHV